METLRIALAGLHYRFELEGYSCGDALRARYASFLDGGTAAAGEIPVRLAATSEQPERIGDFRATFAGALARFAREDVEVAEAPDGSFAGRTEDGPFSVDMLLRGLVNLRCARAGMLLLHAAGFVRGGAAAVHPGLEGAGKSTLARRRRAEGWELLSDELVVVDPARREAWATPFMGELPDARPRGPFPLAAVEILSGWGEDRAVPLSPLAALRRLAPLAVNYGPETELSDRFYEALVELAGRFEIRALTFAAHAAPSGKDRP